MNYITNVELWNKIVAYDFDDPWVKVPFSARLARESGWSLAHVQMVIDAYRRFIYLVCISNERLSPSPDVDKAWHLHLTYTKDYWKRFCGETLGQEVHHYPSSGASEAEVHLRHAYAKTLALLAKEFGEEPPVAVWPAVRLDAGAKRTVVHTSRNFIAPKAVLRFGVGVTLVLACMGTLWHSGLLPMETAIVLTMLGVILVACFFLPSRRRSKANDGGRGGDGACDSGGDAAGCGGGD